MILGRHGQDGGPPSPRWSPPSPRAVLYAALAIVVAVTPFGPLLPSPVRATVAFVFVLLGPGSAVIGWWPLRAPLFELLIAVVLSLVLTTAAGEVMLTLHAWSPTGYAAVVAPAVVIMLVRHVVVETQVRRRPHLWEITPWP